MWLRVIEGVGMALAAVSLTSIARALAPKRLLEQRPLSCDVCMSFWMALWVALTVAILALVMKRTIRLDSFVLLLPAHGLALIILSRLRPPSFEFPKETSDG